jgi:hypothetical protein
MLLPNRSGGYSFLRGIGPYSAGVAAAPGFAIEHVRLAQAVPLRTGFAAVEARLAVAGRPRAALCAMALRSPAPFTFPGFAAFNASYVELLKAWDLLLDGVNPVARTNVAPELDPPGEPSLYSFSYTVPAAGAPLSFVVAGAGELPEGSLRPEDVVRGGENTPDALAAKARFVLDLMKGRLHGLGAAWERVTATNIYTVHDVNALLPAEILPRIGAAGRHGVVWHYTRPPIVSIEYEMDLRGGVSESIFDAGSAT